MKLPYVYIPPAIDCAEMEKVAPRIWRPRQQSAQVINEKLKEQKDD